MPQTSLRSETTGLYARVAVISMAAALVPVAVTPQSPAERLDSLAGDYFESGRLHGGVLVADSSGVIYRAAFGLADREEGIPNLPGTLYPVHSNTKSLTAVLVLQLVADGYLELEATVADYLPSVPSSAWGAVRIHQLLSHRSGIPDYFFASSPVYAACSGRNLSTEVLLERVGALPVEFSPGAGFSYSNTGYVVLARIVEEVTDEPYAQVLRARILDPLGMTSTRWVARLEDRSIARQYSSEAGGEVPLETVHPGQSGVVSTLDDMFAFVQALGSSSLLPPDLWQAAFSAHSLPEEAALPIPPHFFPHGYGFALEEPPAVPERAVLMGGSGCGGTAFYYRRLESGQMVVLWNNQGDLPPDFSLVAQLLALLP